MTETRFVPVGILKPLRALDRYTFKLAARSSNKPEGGPAKPAKSAKRSRTALARAG